LATYIEADCKVPGTEDLSRSLREAVKSVQDSMWLLESKPLILNRGFYAGSLLVQNLTSPSIPNYAYTYRVH
jgi:hypothetical protein